jgi:hypothetical protein
VVSHWFGSFERCWDVGLGLMGGSRLVIYRGFV